MQRIVKSIILYDKYSKGRKLINSKNGAQVRIVRKWDGNTSPIRDLSGLYVLSNTKENRQDRGKEERKKIKTKMDTSIGADTSRYEWVERLL